METASAMITEWGLRVLGALVLLVVGMILAKAVRAMVRSASTSSGSEVDDAGIDGDTNTCHVVFNYRTDSK